MTPVRRVTWLGLVLLLLQVLASCGGSGGADAALTATAAAAPRVRALDIRGATGVSARFVRLQAMTEVNGNPWTSVAEFNVLDAAGAALPRTGWVASADSQEVAGEFAPADRALDGDRYSFWHTQWKDAAPPLPHQLTVDLGSVQAIGGFKYLPRQVGENGRIAGWRFFTSADAATWTLAAQGTFPNSADEVTVTLAAAAPVDQPPVLGTLPDRSDVVGQPVVLSVAASDPDGDTLAFTASGLPPGLAIDAATGSIAGTPTSAGTFATQVSVSDGRGGTAGTTFNWLVAAAPSADGGGSVARYVRLEARSEVNGHPWTSVAEFNVLDANGAPLARGGWTVDVDSQELVGEDAPAARAIDGDAGTFWHTQWKDAAPPPPHRLSVDLGTAHAISGFRYLPRQTNENGRIADWRFYTSPDGSAWTLAAQGTFPNSADEATVRLADAAGTPPAGPVTPAPPTPPVPPTSPARVARIAAFASGPLVAGTAWRAGEAVAVDTVRRLVSGHHLVYIVAGTTGNVEPVVGDTALDGRPIFDGGATGYLNGRVLTASQPGAPSVDTAASPAAAGLVLTSFASGDYLPARYAAVQGCRSISTGTSFIGHYCFANGPAGGSGNATAIASGTWGAGLSPDYVYHTNSWEEEFVVTDARFGLVFANSASSINVEVDGVQVEAAPSRSSGAEGWTLTLDYHGDLRRRTVRVVSAAGSVAPTLRGVALSAQGRVESGSTSADQVLVFGDSINATVVPATEAGTQMMSYWVQRDLGFGGAINLAVGGSGYVSQNPGSFNLPNLLAAPVNRTLIAGYAPFVTHVIVGAGFNDRGRPLADVQAAALGSWKTLRALLPNAKISITDGWSGSSGPDANALALAAGLATTFAAWGDPNARLIHSVGGSAASAYVSGTGNAGTPLAAGNSSPVGAGNSSPVAAGNSSPVAAGNSSFYTSVDAVHPSPAGARYLARRLSDDIAAAWGGAY